MSNPSLAKGTAAATAVVNHLRANGWPYAERRALNGNKDRGDIAGVIGVVIEVKDCRTLTFGPWLNEALVEQANDGADVGVVWAKRVRHTDPADWYVVMTGQQFTDLLLDAGYGVKATTGDAA